MSYNFDSKQAVIFNRYFADIEASTSAFQKAILPLLNSDWDKKSELLVEKIQSFSDGQENNIYRECILATKDYINSRDFIAPNKYETTSYFYDALQYNSESQALKDLNQKLDQLIQDIPGKNIYWQESFENLWLKTASTLFSAFDFAKEHPLSTITALLYGQVALASAFPAVFNLSSLDGANGIKINGEAKYDQSGYSVSSAGDINGDGIADLIIGARQADSNAGSSYVVFGKQEAWATLFELSTLNGANGFKINGEGSMNYSGSSVSSVGDINGDGIDDLIIGAPSASPGGRSYAGSSYVIFGKSSTWTTPLELSTLSGANGFKINGEVAYDNSGGSVSSVGDINGDGIADLIIGACQADSDAGSSYVIFGKKEAWTTPFELSTLDGTNGFKINGEAESDSSGSSVSSAGDINGDGIDDLIVGAPFAAPNGETDAGSSYVIFGKNGTWTTPFELSTLNGTNGFKINSGVANDLSGSSVSSAGDVNGDGIGDIIIGAPYYDSVLMTTSSGSSYVIFGKNDTWITPFNLSMLDGINGFKINGEAEDDYNGGSVSAAGDINGDGIDDLIVGAAWADPNEKDAAGSSYVIFGKKEAWVTPFNLSALDSTNGFKIIGEAAGDISGHSVSAAGDINGDGAADLIIGAHYASPNGKDAAGSSYVIFGNSTNLPPVLIGNSSSIDYVENEPAKVIDNNIIVTDVNNVDLINATIAITNNFHYPEDSLIFSDQNGISGFYNNATGVLTLTGGSSIAYYQIALRDIAYKNLVDNPVTDMRTITFMVNDGVENSNAVTRDINIITVNDAPVLTNSGGSFDYTENDPATIIDSSITISDVDNVNLTNATIAITNNFHYPEDVLIFANQNGISGFYNNATGVLTLTGSSGIGNYQIALCSVTYENISNDPNSDVRTITFIANDGVDNSNAVTRNINIIPINDVPVLTNSGGSFEYTENDSATIVDSSITISDVDNVNLTNATIAITNNFHYPEDVLIFVNQNGISGFYNNATGVLTLTGSSGIGNYQIALCNVTYENTSDDPNSDVRTITFIANDGVDNSNAVTRNINIIPINAAPVLTNSGGSFDYTENDSATIIDSSITISDIDHTDLTNATIAITNNFHYQEDVLIFADQNGISGFYSNATGVLTLTGSSSMANYRIALCSVTYENTSDDPNSDVRTITFMANDGVDNSNAATRNINIIPVNDVPVLTNSGGSFDYTENDSATIVDSSITISDVDNADLTNATIAIINNFHYPEDVLIFANQNGISGIYNNATGVLTLTGSSSIANYQTALGSITYENTSDDPNSDVRTITFMANDGVDNSNAVTRNINIIPVNDVPVLTNSGGSFDYTENDPATIIDSSITISDVDNVNLTNATIAITNNFHYPEDVLIFANQNGISGFYNNATGVLTLTGGSSIANYQIALCSVTYENTSDDPNSDVRTITFMANDGVDNSNAVTRNINIIPVNDVPVLTNNGGGFDYTENDSATIVDSSITISDVDHADLTNATIAITNNFHYPEDVLIFANQNGISGFYNNATGVLTLTGGSSIANYQIALCSVTYENTSNDPNSDVRTITFIANDGVDNSNAVTRNINIIPVNDAPVLTNSGGSFDYTENDSATIVDSSVTISDVDHADLTNATIAITNNFHYPEDVLIFANQNGISGFYNNATGVLALTGFSSLANYQSALHDVRYENLEDNPVADIRTITFIVNDGVENSNAVTRDINVIAVNDAPVLVNGGGSFNYVKSDPATIVDSSVTISDVDNVNLTNATIALANNFDFAQEGLNFTSQNGIIGAYYKEAGLLTLNGSSSVANYQTALRNVTYINLSDHPTIGLRTATFIVNDGVENSNAINRDINIIPVDDAPVITLSSAALNYTEGSGVVAIDPTLTVVDIDHANLTEAVISITNNFDSGQDSLVFIDQHDIEGSYNDTTGILSLTGSSSVANYQAALRNIEYENLSDNPTINPRTITFIVDDGVKTSAPAMRHINIIPVNNAPVLTNSGIALNYTENALATIVDSSIAVFDVDNINLTGATVSITGNFDFTQDRLSFTNQNNIIGSYNSALGVLTLSGSSNITNYQVALRSIRYNNLSENPTTLDRTVSFIVNDGEASSSAITRVIHIISVHDVPVVTLSGSALSYTEKDPAKIIDPNLNIVDLDSLELYWATVSITNNLDATQDVLRFINQHGITGSYNNETGILTLIGTSNIANYQIALRDVRYENLANNPTTDLRSIAFIVNDGFVSSIPAVRNITITAINNTPTTDDEGFDFGSKLFNAILIAGISGVIGLLFLGLRICLYRKATQSFEKLTNIGDVSTTEQQKKFQTNILRPIAQAIFDRIKITGCFGYVSDKRMQDYLSAVTKLIVTLQQQAINMDLDNLSPASQSLLINEIAKQTENVLFPAQGCCTFGACCRCIGRLCSAEISPEVLEAKVVAIAIAIKSALKRNNYDTFLSRQSVGSGSNQSQSKVYEAPIEMAVLGGGLFAKSGNAPLPMPVNRVAAEKPVFENANVKPNQVKEKVCAIDLVYPK